MSGAHRTHTPEVPLHLLSEVPLHLPLEVPLRLQGNLRTGIIRREWPDLARERRAPSLQMSLGTDVTWNAGTAERVQ